MTALRLPTLYVYGLEVRAPTGLALINRVPAPGEAQVPARVRISVDVTVLGGHLLDEAFTRVWVDGELAFDGAADPKMQAVFNGPEAGLADESLGSRIRVHPVTSFVSEADVSVRVVARTLDGGDVAATLDETYVFTAEDRTAPKVAAAAAVGPKTIRVVFGRGGAGARRVGGPHRRRAEPPRRR